jgi:hypothetical protein
MIHGGNSKFTSALKWVKNPSNHSGYIAWNAEMIGN